MLACSQDKWRQELTFLTPICEWRGETQKKDGGRCGEMSGGAWGSPDAEMLLWLFGLLSTRRRFRSVETETRQTSTRKTIRHATWAGAGGLSRMPSPRAVRKSVAGNCVRWRRSHHERCNRLQETKVRPMKSCLGLRLLQDNSLNSRYSSGIAERFESPLFPEASYRQAYLFLIMLHYLLVCVSWFTSLSQSFGITSDFFFFNACLFCYPFRSC